MRRQSATNPVKPQDPHGVRDGLQGVASDEQINRGALLLAQRPVGWSVRIRLIPCGRHRVFLAP